MIRKRCSVSPVQCVTGPSCSLFYWFALADQSEVTGCKSGEKHFLRTLMWPVKNRVVSPFLFFFLPEYTMRMEKRPTSTECQSVPLNVPWPSSTWRVLQSWPEWWTTHTRICRRAICRSNRCFWKRLIPIHLLTSAVSLVGGPDQWLLSMHRYEWWKIGHRLFHWSLENHLFVVCNWIKEPITQYQLRPAHDEV